MYVVFLIIGMLCLVYFVCIALFAGYGTNFFFIWLLLGAGALAFAFLIKRGIWREHVPILIKYIVTGLFCVGIIVFIIVEGLIISGFFMKAPSGIEYLVVLGAQMKESGPSKALQYRLDAALDYLQENPEARVIVSGGQGADEHISEAQGMFDYLAARGISHERIILEDRSKNTVQNLTFSAEFLDIDRDKVAVVSSNFHMYRAVEIAERIGYKRLYGIAARGEPFFQLNNMMREFFGIAKDTVYGNM